MTTVGLTHWADILTVILYFVFVLGVGIWVRINVISLGQNFLSVDLRDFFSYYGSERRVKKL